MLMHTECSQRILRRPDRMERLILPYIPQLDLSITAPTDEFSQPAPLQMHIGDPLFVVAPDFDHGHGGAKTLVEDADRAVAIAADEDIAGDLVRGEGGDAGAGAGGDVLSCLASSMKKNR